MPSNQQSRQRNAPETRAVCAASIRALEGQERTFELSFSSEEPYSRWWGVEILDHSENALDLSRLNEIGVLLFNHDVDVVLGRVESASLKDGRGTAICSFDSDEESERIYQKVKSGTLKGVSVRYSVDSWEEVAAGKTSADGKFTGPCEIARKWTPLEISIVSVPADATVGVGRDMKLENKEEGNNMADGARAEEGTTVTNETPAVTPPVADDAQTGAQRAVADERQRVADITSMCRDFGIDSTEMISGGHTIEQARAAVLERLKTTHAPVGARVTEDEGDKLKAAAIDGLLLRCGRQVEKPNDGANSFRGMSLKEIVVECMRQEGVTNASRLNHDEILRQYMTPTNLFTSIMDLTARKVFEQAYTEAPTTYEQWTKKGTLKDFRPTKSYTIGHMGELLPVPENGELKHDKPFGVEGPERRLATYGRQFSMSREAFINDDIDFISQIPALYAQSAKLGINRAVYMLLASNPVIYDGHNAYSAEHKNISGISDSPSVESLGDMRRLMRNQKAAGSEAKLNLTAKLILLPTTLELRAEQLLRTSIDPAANVSGIINPFYNSLAIIADAELDDLTVTSGKEWYIMSDINRSPIQVDYLNGVDSPIIEMKVPPAGQLGYIWDIYMDYGITFVDWRGTVKNNGK